MEKSQNFKVEVINYNSDNVIIRQRKCFYNTTKSVEMGLSRVVSTSVESIELETES